MKKAGNAKVLGMMKTVITKNECIPSFLSLSSQFLERFFNNNKKIGISPMLDILPRLQDGCLPP